MTTIGKQQSTDDTCPICHEPFSGIMSVNIPCTSNVSHRVCMSCLVQMQNRLCPLCRRSFAFQVVHVLNRIPVHVRYELIELIRQSIEGEIFEV